MDINLPFTCRQGWIGLGVISFIICLTPIIVNYNDLGIESFILMIMWVTGFLTLILCTTAEERGWSFPKINCRCDRD